MFGKKVNPADYRAHPRYSAENMSVVIDGVTCTLHDYSDGGVRISSVRQTRRVALIEIFKNGRCIRKSPAIVAWRRESQVGYAFRSNLKVFEVDGAEEYHRVDSAETEDRGQTRNATGAVAGNALRARLRM